MAPVCKFSLLAFILMAVSVGGFVEGALDAERDFIALGSVPRAAGSRSERDADAGAGIKAKTFFLSRISVSWDNAWFECRQAHRGVLAEPENRDEDNFIQDSLIAQGYASAWLSGTYESTSVGWIWAASGNPINPGYQNWGPSEPRYNTTLYRVNAYRVGVTTYYWRALSSTTLQYFVCQST